MDKWKNKYRIASARADWWNYANDGAYFITICTHNRTHFFGECVNGQMRLSTAGAIVQGLWYEIPKHFWFVELGEFVVMPNHIHGVLILDKIGLQQDIENGMGSRDKVCLISPEINNDQTFAQMRFQNQGKDTISSIIGSYKSACTKHINLAFPNLGFAWQKLFWDNIIRNEAAFDKITDYIIRNPANWEQDKFYTLTENL